MTTLTVERLTDARLPALGALAFSVALALASQFAVPVPGTPVPITLQPLVVVLAGLVLGPAAGAASMTIYLAAGVIGLPVFAPIGPPGIGRLLGPTGGYLLAYPAAAAIAGVIGSRSAARPAPGFSRRAAAAAAGIVVLYVGGTAQLVVLTGSFGRAFALGVPPFAAFDVLKALAAAALASKSAPRRRR